MHCYRCGVEAARNDNGFWECPGHKQLWMFQRNAPCADAMVIQDGKLLMIKRANEPYKGMWAMPGGFQEFGEHPAVAAAREAQEETGLVIRIESLLGIYIQKISDDEYRQVTVFIASPLDGEIQASDDASDCEWFDINSIPEDAMPYHKVRITDYLNGVSPDRVHVLHDI